MSPYFFRSFSFLILMISCGYAHAQIGASRNISAVRTFRTSSGLAPQLSDQINGGSTWSVKSNSWIAMDIGSRDQVFVLWNNPNYSWSDVISRDNSCKQTIKTLTKYAIQTSANSTSGKDGDWTTRVSVTDNTVTSRGHLITTSGDRWLRISITEGSGELDEISIFDCSTNTSDIWMFPGTSISANTFKATPPAKSFADHITAGHTAHDPMIIKAGIPCINSNDLKKYVDQYIAMTPEAKYWAIEMGTNDAWGGSALNAAAFKSNLQYVIDACRAADIEPIIARVLSTNASAAGWQIHQNFLTAVDDLVASNNLHSGPDLYGWFIDHPDHLGADGVHPNATGAASIQRLWAEAVVDLYGEADSTAREDEVIPLSKAQTSVEIFPNPVVNGEIFIKNTDKVSVYKLYDLSGSLVKSWFVDAPAMDLMLTASGIKSGVYLLQWSVAGRMETIKLIFQ